MRYFCWSVGLNNHIGIQKKKGNDIPPLNTTLIVLPFIWKHVWFVAILFRGIYKAAAEMRNVEWNEEQERWYEMMLNY